MRRFIGLLLIVLTLSVFGGCAGKMNPNFESPVVSLHTFRALPQQGMTPSFEIGLNILNPNRDPLELEGIYYTVAIEGYQVLAGVSNDLPTVDAYGQADITLIANVDVIGGINFFASLINEPREVFEFSFNAKLDPGGFNPKILIQEKGEFNLGRRI